MRQLLGIVRLVIMELLWWVTALVVLPLSLGMLKFAPHAGLVVWSYLDASCGLEGGFSPEICKLLGVLAAGYSIWIAYFLWYLLIYEALFAVFAAGLPLAAAYCMAIVALPLWL